MAERIHAHGAACTVQLTHGGRRERWDSANWLPAYSASCRRELVHRSFPVEMEHHDIARAHRDYAQAVRRAREGHLDGVEISCQAGTLIEQFWSPAINHREDEYGGSLENRMRFGLELVEAVRREVGADFIVGIRMSGDEMMEGGLSHEDCIENREGLRRARRDRLHQRGRGTGHGTTRRARRSGRRCGCLPRPSCTWRAPSGPP